MKIANNVVIEKRALEVGEKFVLCKGATVRSIANEFGISKSTAYVDLTEHLKNTGNISLYNEVRQKLEINKEERHIRGGEATKQKYLKNTKSR